MTVATGMRQRGITRSREIPRRCDRIVKLCFMKSIAFYSQPDAYPRASLSFASVRLENLFAIGLAIGLPTQSQPVE